VLHPAQKPVEAFVPLIEAYSTVGDIVLDPFAGSGTTAVAAQQVGRHYIAIEKVEQYHQVASARLRDCASEAVQQRRWPACA
jgi:site-specific DNA-methyltransferase (adenine-specific)